MSFIVRRSTAAFAACALSLFIVAPSIAAAQDDAAAPPPSTPGGGVARVSLLDGDVAVQRGDAADSLAAAVNAPILGGDYIVTGAHSRAEIQIDGYAQLRVGDNVQMRFTRLDANARDVQLAAGTIDLRLYRTPQAGTSIDTPSVGIKPQRGGSYRITVTDGSTLVTVRSGDAQIDTPQGARDLQPGATLAARGDADDPTVQTLAEVAPDDFDDFNLQRDGVYARAATAAAYVNPQIDGVADLAADGRWVDDDGYGQVWVPAGVGPDWAPYRDGRWVWEDGYGWTWIAAESWGWAPYHYGSWFHSAAYGWAWCPPRPQIAVVWRPALVAFIGFGAGAGFTLGFAGGAGFANIGWVPLAPFEPYRPWWGSGYGHAPVYNDTNVTNVTNITNVSNVNVYANARYGAVSSVSSQRFIQGDFTGNAAVSPAQLRTAHVFAGAPPVVPTVSNLRFTHAASAPALAVRTDLMQRPFAGAAVAVRRTPFTAQRTAFAAATHAAVTPLHFKDAQTTPLEPAASTGEAPPRTAPAARTPAAGTAWDRFNEQRAPRATSASAGDAYRPEARSNSDRAPVPANAYRAPAPSDAYHETAPVNTYHAPASAQRSAVRAPHADLPHPQPPHAPAAHERAPRPAKTAAAHHEHDGHPG